MKAQNVCNETGGKYMIVSVIYYLASFRNGSKYKMKWRECSNLLHDSAHNVCFTVINVAYTFRVILEHLHLCTNVQVTNL